MSNNWEPVPAQDTEPKGKVEKRGTVTAIVRKFRLPATKSVPIKVRFYGTFDGTAPSKDE